VLLGLVLLVWLLSMIPGKLVILRPRTAKPVTPSLVNALLAKASAFPKLPTAAPTAPGNPTFPPTKPAPLWEQFNETHNFPEVAIITLAVDPGDASIIYAGTNGAGIYISRDGGQSWSPSNQGLGKGTVGKILIHPEDSNILYASLADQGGVYQSTDGGRTWLAANRGIDLGLNWNWTAFIDIARSDPDVLYFSATNSGVYRSEDGGLSWNLRNWDCPQATGLVVDPVDSDHLYAPNRGHGQEDCPPGVYESRDGGLTWRRLTSDDMTDPQGNAWWRLAADERNPKRMISSGDKGTYLTGDSGKTWQQVNEPCEWLAINPQDGVIFCRQNGGLWVSRDEGQGWEQRRVINAPHSLGSTPIAFAPDSQTIYLGDGAVLKSPDGGENWHSLDALGAARLRLVIDPTDSQRQFLSTLDKPGKILRSADGGKSWWAVLEGIEPGGRLTVDPGGVVYYPNPSGVGNALLRSVDGGDTWEQFGQGHPVNGPTQLLIDPQNDLNMWLVGECGSPLAVSQDGGKTFTPAPGSPENLCQSILLADASGQTLYLINWGTSYRSDDGGATWTALADAGGILRAAVLDPQEVNTVYLGSTYRGVLKSTDGGQTWQPENTGLPALAVNDLVLDPRDPQTIYAATDGGAFVSRNGGGLWQPLGDELGSNPLVYSIAVDPGDPGTFYVVTPDGVFRLWREM
jgi:photosystem II stability/assembly factor-like uncharacterized protein